MGVKSHERLFGVRKGLTEKRKHISRLRTELPLAFVCGNFVGLPGVDGVPGLEMAVGVVLLAGVRERTTVTVIPAASIGGGRENLACDEFSTVLGGSGNASSMADEISP